MKIFSAPKNASGEDKVLHLLSAVITGRFSLMDVSPGQWPDMVDAALTNGLGPMLFQAADAFGREAYIGPAWAALAGSARQAAAFDILYEESMAAISRAFASAGIPALWLKGAVLARTVYPKSSLRPMGDLDILVPQDQAESALNALKNLGYRFDHTVTFRPFHPDKIDEDYLKRLASHHYVLTGGGSAVTVELHFGLFAHSGGRLLGMEQMAWFWDHTRPFGLADETMCMGLTPEAHLLYLAAHHIFQHGESQACLMRDLDMHLLISRNQLNWKMVIDQAAVLGWTGAVGRALERAVDYFDTMVPDNVFSELAQKRPYHEDPLLALRKQVPGYRWDRVRERLSLLPAREKMRYFFQSLFPTGNYMRSRYGIASGCSVWSCYPYRWFDQIREMIRAMRQRGCSGRDETS